ncbi:MAG: hypothetical protein EBZ77_09695 [Chitinophagia bacterium]|nr:hypothetical protein [Chitinophagia bacterium]
MQVAVTEKSEQKLNDVITVARTYLIDKKDLTEVSYRISFYKDVKNWEQCALAMDAFFNLSAEWSGEYINGLCWNMYEECKDPKLLARACNWMDKVVTKEPVYGYLDTYASLLYATGQKKPAQQWAEKAIATGKAAGEDVKGTEELLARIKALK